MSVDVEHKIAEAMAASWDEQGHRAPWNWRVECSCGWKARDLKGQTQAYDAWRAHIDAAERAA